MIEDPGKAITGGKSAAPGTAPSQPSDSPTPKWRRDFLAAGQLLPAESGRQCEEGGGGASAARPIGTKSWLARALVGSLALGNRHHGVGLQDRSVHPKQRPGQPGGRVPAHAGLGGRLPAPGCNGRVTPRGSGRAGRAGRVAAPQRAPVGCTAPRCDGLPRRVRC